MKYPRIRLLAVLCVLLVGLMAGERRAQAQGAGNRLFNPYAVRFARAWTMTLTDPVKLIEVAPLSGDKHNLILLIASADPNDYKRRLRVTHWDGLRFATDDEVEVLGKSVDTLLAGAFRPPKQAPPEAKPKGKRPSAPPVERQIVATTGIFAWNNNRLNRILEAPPGVKLMLELEKTPAQLVTGSGDAATLFEVKETEVQQVPQFTLPEESPGFVRFGVGMQDFDGVEALSLPEGARYLQTYWHNRSRWMIGLIRGKPAPTPEAPTATTGDRLVVFVPKVSNRDKSFWMMKPDDMEAMEPFDPMPGRILDVRVGDPKNEGKEGLLVLTSEDNGKSRRLTFFAPATGLR